MRGIWSRLETVDLLFSLLPSSPPTSQRAFLACPIQNSSSPAVNHRIIRSSGPFLRLCGSTCLATAWALVGRGHDPSTVRRGLRNGIVSPAESDNSAFAPTMISPGLILCEGKGIGRSTRRLSDIRNPNDWSIQQVKSTQLVSASTWLRQQGFPAVAPMVVPLKTPEDPRAISRQGLALPVCHVYPRSISCPASEGHKAKTHDWSMKPHSKR